MITPQRLSIIAIVLVCVTHNAKTCLADPRAQALLHRVCDARNSSDFIDVTLTMKGSDIDDTELHIVQSESQAISSFYTPKRQLHASILDDGDFLWIYRTGGDVVRVSRDSPDKDAYPFFDARILGLSVLCTCHENLDELVWDRMEGFAIKGTDTIDGIDCTLVETSRDSYRFTYWINEPTARIIRRDVDGKGIHTSITSRFDGDAKFDEQWVPSSTAASRWDGITRHASVLTFSTKQGGDSPFSLKAMNIPFATPVIDKVAHRRLGYWDGEKIVEEYPSSSD